MKRFFAVAFVLLLVFTSLPLVAVAEDSDGYCMNLSLSSVNGECTAAALVVYTAEKGSATGTSGNCAEYVVDSNGIITAVNKNNSAIPADGFVLSAGVAKKKSLSDVAVGDYVYFDKDYNTVTLVSNGYSPFGTSVLSYDGINVTRADNKLIIYRGKETSGTNTWGYEAVVDANGIIVSVGGNNNEIPEGGYVISGVGNKKQPIEAACELGYKAVLDEAAKTVTVSYGKDNAIESYVLRKNEYYEAYENAVNSFANIEQKAAEASVGKLDALIEEMKTALASDKINEFMALSYSFESETQILENALIPSVPVETRALWLRIPTKKDKQTVEKVVKDIYDMGFNSVCIELLFDSTTIMPMPEDSCFKQNPVFGGEDMLKLYIDEFHKYGIEVHAWMSCYRVGHDASGNIQYSVAKQKPEWLNMDSNGEVGVTNEYGTAYFLNPALAEVREFLLENYKYILENYEIDGFQLDYVRYPENTTINYGYDEFTMSEFLKAYPKYGSVPVTSSQAGYADWCKFRAAYVTQLVTAVGELIDEIRPDVLFSCDVAPEYPSSINKMCQDTETWLKEGIVDVIYPMAYGTTDAVAKWTTNTVALGGNAVQTVVGLRDNGATIYREQIVKARECGADGTAFFSYSQYVDGDYIDLIKETVFKNDAICPSYNAKKAIIAEIDYISETVNVRMPLALDSVPDDVKQYSEALLKLSAKLTDSTVEEQLSEIKTTVEAGRTLVEKYSNSELDSDKNIAEFLSNALRIIEKTAINSRDALKAEYRNENQDESQGSEENSSTENNASELNAFEKVFQVIFIIIMSIGILGLPAYYWLNARKKRLAEEYKNGNRTDDSDEENKANEEFSEEQDNNE